MDCIGNRSLISLLHDRWRLTPDQIFLVHEDPEGRVTSLTYRDFITAVAQFSAGLRRLGVGPDSKICLHMGNRPEFLIAWFAIASLRAAMVPSNTANTQREMAYILRHTDAEMVITEPPFAPVFSPEFLGNCPAVRSLVLAGPLAGDPGGPAPGCLRFADLMDSPRDLWSELPAPGDLMELLFTSGTTAVPKAVMLAHGNGVWCGLEQARQLGLRPEDRNLTNLPLFHVNAQALALSTLTVGATLVLLQRYSASRYMDQVRRHQATSITIVPTLLRTLLVQPPSPSDREHRVRCVKYAINVADAERQAFEDRFGLAGKLVNGYGMSETMVTVVGSPLYGDLHWPAIGLPLIGREVRIVLDGGSEAPPGQVGEITVRGVPGRNLMLGYYKDPAATAAAVRDGWFHTGDLGYTDPEGYVYFFGRQKETIKRGGENVSASEVEMVLASHPGVLEVAVIRSPDLIYDEAVKAVLVVEPGTAVDTGALQAFCARHLAKFKVPSLYEFRASLPKTAIGKIDKGTLQREEDERGPLAQRKGV